MTPKLGLAGHKEDPRGRTLKLRDFLAPGFAVPQSCDLTFGMIPDTDPLGNVEHSNCGIAAPGHFERWQDQRCGRTTTVDTPAVLREYENFGYVPGEPETDAGVYALDVMRRWRSVGLFGLEPIGAFVQVDHYDAAQVQAATFLGGWFACYQMPRRVIGLDTWGVTDDDGPDAGGHMVWMKATDTGNSWGTFPLVTPAFRARRCFDGYCVISRRGLVDGVGFAGLDLDKMRAALAVVTG